MPQLTDVFRSVFPLLTGSDERPEILGTAVYCAVERHRFLVTAAHVLDRCQNRVIEFPGGVCPLPSSGLVVSSDLPASGNRADDEVDVAVLRLSVDQTSAFAALGVRPVQIDRSGVDDQAHDGQRYAFTGYPSSRNRIIRARRTMDPEILSAIGRSATSQEMTELQRRSEIHVAALYDRENMMRNGVRVTGPEAWGMSGGAVWKLEEATQECTLVGVGTDWNVERGFLVGTRIGAAVVLMRAGFPETLPFLPVPARFSVSEELEQTAQE